MEDCISIKQESCSIREKPKFFDKTNYQLNFDTRSTYYFSVNVNDASSLPNESNFFSLNENIRRLNSFSNLKQNWNNNNANPFNDKLIYKAFNILTSLNYSPEVFPTGRDSIQFEFEKDNGDYLEFEIFATKILSFSMINDITSEKKLSRINQINRILNQFYA